MPFSASSAPRRMSSCQFVLPPSTIRSPASRSPASCWTVFSVGSPAGTMTHTARGLSSLETRSSRPDAPRAPTPSAVRTASSLKSNATTSWSESRLMRCTMLPPIFPRPTKPICMFLPLDRCGDSVDGSGEVAGAQAHAHSGQAVAAQRLEVAVRLGVDELAEVEALLGDVGVLVGVVHQLQKAAGGRAALVILA